MSKTKHGAEPFGSTHQNVVTLMRLRGPMQAHDCAQCAGIHVRHIGQIDDDHGIIQALGNGLKGIVHCVRSTLHTFHGEWAG